MYYIIKEKNQNDISTCYGFTSAAPDHVTPAPATDPGVVFINISLLVRQGSINDVTTLIFWP